MFRVIQENLGTILVTAALLAVVVCIVVSMGRKKKQGKCVSCDCCAKDCHLSGK